MDEVVGSATTVIWSTALLASSPHIGSGGGASFDIIPMSQCPAIPLQQDISDTDAPVLIGVKVRVASRMTIVKHTNAADCAMKRTRFVRLASIAMCACYLLFTNYASQTGASEHAV
ncbi:MAG TPA: hypothetical protein VL866_22325 [Pyrinomonadaceae bacterium]|nr:hypothetical protein [Pyrinomonadaceae bacterium]